MKTPGEAAMDLPWLVPSVASLTMLARSPFASAWTQLRTDPGIVLLHARLMEDHSVAPPTSPIRLDVVLLESVLANLVEPRFTERGLPEAQCADYGFVDWSHAGPASIHRVCCRQAMLAPRGATTTNADW